MAYTFQITSSGLFTPYNIYRTLTCPNTNNTVSPPLNQIAISYSYTLDNRRGLALFSSCDARSAFPLSALNLIIHLDHVFTSRADDSSCVKHHACDGVLVRVSVIYRSCTEIPYLKIDGQHSYPGMKERKKKESLTLILLSKLPVTRWTSSNCKQVTAPVCPTRLR